MKQGVLGIARMTGRFREAAFNHGGRTDAATETINWAGVICPRISRIPLDDLRLYRDQNDSAPLVRLRYRFHLDTQLGGKHLRSLFMLHSCWVRAAESSHS